MNSQPPILFSSAALEPGTIRPPSLISRRSSRCRADSARIGPLGPPGRRSTAADDRRVARPRAPGGSRGQLEDVSPRGGSRDEASAQAHPNPAPEPACPGT
ncbi:hypothetical protein THAOC_23011, partial [Thalassiosira oceanica]